MNNIPASVLEKGLELAETGTVYGKKLTELTPEELLAVAAFFCNRYLLAFGRKSL